MDTYTIIGVALIVIGSAGVGACGALLYRGQPNTSSYNMGYNDGHDIGYRKGLSSVFVNRSVEHGGEPLPESTFTDAGPKPTTRRKAPETT